MRPGVYGASLRDLDFRYRDQVKNQMLKNIIEWFRFEGTLKITLFQPPCHGRFCPGPSSAVPPLCCAISKLLRVHSVPLSVSLIKELKSTGPKRDPWGSPLVAILHLDIPYRISTERRKQLSLVSFASCKWTMTRIKYAFRAPDVLCQLTAIDFR